MAELLHTDGDYVHCKRFGNSLARVLKRYKDAECVSDAMISSILLIPLEDIPSFYEEVAAELRVLMGVAL